MGMKVFGPPNFTNVARVLVCLEEIGAEYEVIPIDFAAGQHKSPAHIARHVIFLCSNFHVFLFYQTSVF